jgi:hypothetical protein
MKQPNEALRRARERSPSPSHPEECLSRQELAELVNAYVGASPDPGGDGRQLHR